MNSIGHSLLLRYHSNSKESPGAKLKVRISFIFGEILAWAEILVSVMRMLIGISDHKKGAWYDRGLNVITNARTLT